MIFVSAGAFAGSLTLATANLRVMTVGTLSSPVML